MAYSDGSTKAFISTNDLSAKQFYIVKPDTAAGKIVLAAAATDKLLGVNMGIPKAGDLTEVRLRNSAGSSHVIAGGTIAINDALTSDANGKAIATTTGSDQILGYSLAVAAAGDIFEFVPSTGKY